MDEIITRYNRRRSRGLAVGERLLRSILRPYVTLLVFATLANVVVAITTGALPWLIQQMIDRVFTERDAAFLLILPIAIVVISLIRAAATYGGNVMMSFVGQRAITDIQKSLLGSLVYGDLANVHERHSGEYMSIFMTDTIRLRDSMINTIITLARNLLTLVVLTFFMFTINAGMALVYMLIVIPAGLLMMRRLGRVTRKASRQGLEGAGDFTSLIAETLHGLRIVKSYGQEERQLARAYDAVENVLEHNMTSTRARAAAGPSVEMLAGIAIGVLVLIGGYQSLENNLTAGAFMGFITALLASYQPLRAVANIQTVLQEGVSAATRIFSVLDRPNAITEKPDAPVLAVSGGAMDFKDVRFHYAERDMAALDGIDLSVKAGQTVALVGASGAGKSTLINAVLRFFDTDSGTINIDGQNIRDVGLASLRRATGLVTQDPLLFDDSIAANIAFGKPDASQSDIEQAAQIAAAHDFIAQLPQGYNTRVGESGMRLSGGQKQRIAIARAVLRDAPILLLDEATSALDTTSELQVQEALARLMQGRSVLVIAHRLSTIINADKICVMEAGRIIEQGTHTALLAQQGAYATLHEKQFAQGER